MSILIKDMEMPKACWECPLKVHLFQQLWCTPSSKVINRDDNTKREPDCPLIEVKSPHGRLIEEPKELYYGGLVHISPFDFVGTAKYFMDQIKKQPTIIEAEGSET